MMMITIITWNNKIIKYVNNWLSRYEKRTVLCFKYCMISVTRVKGWVNHHLPLMRMAILIGQKDHVLSVQKRMVCMNPGCSLMKTWPYCGWAVSKFWLCKWPVFYIDKFLALHKTTNFCFSSIKNKNQFW